MDLVRARIGELFALNCKVSYNGLINICSVFLFFINFFLYLADQFMACSLLFVVKNPCQSVKSVVIFRLFHLLSDSISL